MKDLEKDFVPYSVAVRMKELGFDKECLLNVWWLNDCHYQTKELFDFHNEIGIKK